MHSLKKNVLFPGVVLALLLTLTISNLGFAGTEGEEETIEELSREKAINLALQFNPQVELDRISIEKAEMAQKQAEKAAEEIADAKDAPYLFDQVAQQIFSYEGAQGQYVAPRKAEMDKILAENKARAQEDGLKMSAEKAYYDVLKAQTDLDNKQKALDRAKESLRLAKARFKTGNTPKTDVMQAEVDLANAEAGVSSAQSNLELAWLKLNEVMGQPLDKKWKLTDSFSFEKQEIDLESTISQVLEKDMEMIGIREGAAVAAVNFEQAKKYYTPNVYKYREAEYGYREAMANLKKTETKTELKVREAYSNLKSMEKGYSVLEQQLEVMREQARLAQLQYEVGVITQFQLRQVVDGLAEMEAQLNSMLYNYNLLVAQFRYNLFLGASGGF